jgi:hypothetical protein
MVNGTTGKPPIDTEQSMMALLARLLGMFGGGQKPKQVPLAMNDPKMLLKMMGGGY